MNQYELILLFDPSLGEEKTGLVVTKVEEKIKALGGEIEKTDKWGVRKLASMVSRAKSLTQGYYVLIRFKSAPAAPAELRAYLKVNESVIRSFLSRAIVEPAAAVPAEAVSVGEIKGEPIGKPE